MKNTIKSRKGVTLTELVVVLAVVVIAAGMVVTFSSMMHGAQGISNERYEALQDVRTAEALIEGFILNNTEEGCYVEGSINGKFNTLTFHTFDGSIDPENLVSPNPKFVKLFNGAFVMTGNEVIFFEHIKSIEFNIACQNEPNDGECFLSSSYPGSIFYESTICDILYYCTITYEVAKTPYTYTFCVNPYVGEGVN